MNSNRTTRQFSIHRYSAVEFLIALVALFVLAPFVELVPHGDFIDGSLFTVVLGSGVLAVSRNRKMLMAAIILVTPAILSRWIHQFRPSLMSQEFFFVAALVFVVFLIANLLRFILHAGRVNAEVLSAGISTYLLLGMAWMLAYRLVADLSPGAFIFTAGPDSSHAMTGFNAYYFSFITLTTVGYGDIVPVSDIARMLTTMEAVTGTLFMAVLIARLVALHTAPAPSGNPSDPGHA